MSRPPRTSHYGVPANWFMDFSDDFLDALVADMKGIELLFQLEFGLPLYLTWGTLLGAVRDADFIGYDFDIDMAYLTRETEPDEILREHDAIERCMARFGRITSAPHAGRIFLRSVRDQQIGKVPFGIEVYTSWISSDRLYHYPSFPGTMPASDLLPFSPVSLRGQSFNAPTNVDAYLSAEYGPDWRIPVGPSNYVAPEPVKYPCFDFLRTDLAR